MKRRDRQLKVLAQCETASRQKRNDELAAELQMTVNATVAKMAGAKNGRTPQRRNVAVIEAQMNHDAVRLPDGTVHVQNWISGMYGGMGQHHVHTAAEYAEWSKGVAAKYLKLADAKHCGCGLAPGQTREYDGRVW